MILFVRLVFKYTLEIESDAWHRDFMSRSIGEMPKGNIVSRSYV